jgi:beta-glucosidase
MIRKNIACLLFLAGLKAALTAASPPAVEPFRNPDLPVEDRIKDLLKRLTLEEKAAQLQQIEVIPWDANFPFQTPASAKDGRSPRSTTM